MRKYESMLSGARRIGTGALIALWSVTPAFAANAVTEWAETWSPPTGWLGYLFYGAAGLLVVGVALKIFEAYEASMEAEPRVSESTNEEPARAYSIGDHRNSMLNPNN
jgi:hypothetical protein